MKKIILLSFTLITINANAQVHLYSDKVTYELSNNLNWFIEPDAKYIRKEKPFTYDANLGNEINAKKYYEHLCETESFAYKVGSFYDGYNSDELYQKINLNSPQEYEKYKEKPFLAKYYELTRKIEREQFKKFLPNIIEGEETIIVKRKTNQVLTYKKNFSLNDKKCIQWGEYKDIYEIESLNTLPNKKTTSSKINIKEVNFTIKDQIINTELFIINPNDKNNKRYYNSVIESILKSNILDKNINIKDIKPNSLNFLFLQDNNNKIWRQFPFNKNRYDKREIYQDLYEKPLAYLNMIEVENKNNEYTVFFEGKLKKIKEGMLLDFNLNIIDESIYEKYFPLIPPQPTLTTFREFVMNDGTIFKIIYDSKIKRYSPIIKASKIESNRVVKIIKVIDPRLEKENLLMLNWFLYDKNTLNLEMYMREIYTIPHIIKESE